MTRAGLFVPMVMLLLALQPAADRASAQQPAALDYEVFRTKVQPILLAPRTGNARCVSCHATGGGNSYLEPLPPGSTAFTEEQTRRNFERVARLVTPGEPLRSILLMNPLAEDAGGSHWHGGGKHWPTQSHPEWQTLAAWVSTRSTAPLPAVPARPAAAAAPVSAGLDYEVFRTNVQPILLAPRKGNARCVSCHATGGGNSYLEPLPPGSTAFTEEQTRRNFERVARLVTPGQPLTSILLMNPLAEDAGGSHWHGGGKHWPTQSHPEWQTLAAWVRGARP